MNYRPAALFLISAALLGYELILMRLLSAAFWGHFAGFVISISMLGFAASGLFLHFFRALVCRHADRVRTGAALFFAVTAPLAFLVAQAIPFKPFLLAWSWEEYGTLALRMGLFLPPFFAAGVAIGTPFVARVAAPAKLYLWNMAGSGAAAVPILAALHLFHPLTLLLPLAVAAAVASVLTSRHRAFPAVASLVMAVLTLVLWRSDFALSEFKELSKVQTLPGTEVIAEHRHPRGLLHLAESAVTRHHPGLSMQFIGRLPQGRLLFVDGDGMQVLYDPSAVEAAPEFLDATLERFSYQLLDQPKVLLLRTPPSEVLRGAREGVSRMKMLTGHPAMPMVFEQEWGDFLAQHPEIHVRYADPMRYLLCSESEYDLIHISLLGAFAAGAAGAASMDVDFFLTRQGFGEVWNHLTPDGHALFTTWIENPARTGVRLISQVVDLLRDQQIEDPGAHLLILRSWSTLGIYVFREPVEPTQTAALEELGVELGFDLVHTPNLREEQVNQFHVIPDAPYFHATREILEDAEAHGATWPFLLRPTTQDVPFFGHHFRWAALPGMISEMGMEWLPFVEWGYLLQVASLVVAALVGVVVLILPVLISRSTARLSVVGLFFLLGVGYMLVEIWAILRLIEITGDPVTAAGLVLTVMLAASGFGAICIDRLRPHPMLWLVALTVSLGLMFWGLQLTATAGACLPDMVRYLSTILLVALPAFLMGFPFPYSLGRLARDGEVPWALAMNGFGSVIGSLGATLLAVHGGLAFLLGSGWAFYAGITLLILFLRRSR